MSKKIFLQKIWTGIFVVSVLFIWKIEDGKLNVIKHVKTEYETDMKDEGLQTRSSNTIWVYKEENGKKYMRLYDSTNEVWLTDWILFG